MSYGYWRGPVDGLRHYATATGPLCYCYELGRIIQMMLHAAECEVSEIRGFDDGCAVCLALIDEANACLSKRVERIFTESPEMVQAMERLARDLQ